MNLGDYWTIKDAATFLGVSESTLRKWDRDRKLETFRHPINRYRLYRRADLEALLAAIGGSRPVASVG